MKLPLSVLDYSRSVAGEPDIKLRNRYYERDPSNTDNEVALISRPGMRKWLTVGDGPIRGVYSQPGTFDEALFCVSGDTLFKIEQDETITTVGTLGTSTGSVSMAATDTILFVADGASLRYYTENDTARGTLTASAIVANDTVTIGSYVYKFVADVTPTADGSAGTPWLVKLGGNLAESLQHLYDAIGNSGTAGTDYSLAMVANPVVVPSSVTATVLKIRATDAGTGGNAIATTETGAGTAWGAATLAGGGGTVFGTVTVPNNDGIVSVGVIISFCICLVAQGQGRNGRFYWIRPGEVTIQLLDFATAERSPDAAWNIVPMGDHFLIPGGDSTEDWYPTGDGAAPFQRQQGHIYDKGVWEGTVIKIKDDLMMVGTDGTVYRYGAEPAVVSTPGIAQRLREAINAQRAS